MPEFSEFPAIFPTPAQIGAPLDSRNTTANWLFIAQFPAIFDHLPYNLHPIGIQNSARKFRATGNFRGPFADLPQKNQNTTGNWTFLPNFDPFLSTSGRILSRWEFEIAENSRIPEFPELASIFSTPAQIGALLGSRNTTRSWLFLAQFPATYRIIFSRWEFKIALGIFGPPETSGSLSQIIQKLRMRLKIGHFLPNFDPFWIPPMQILSRWKFEKSLKIPEFPESPAISRLLRKSAHSWIAEIRLGIGYF